MRLLFVFWLSILLSIINLHAMERSPGLQQFPVLYAYMTRIRPIETNLVESSSNFHNARFQQSRPQQNKPTKEQQCLLDAIFYLRAPSLKSFTASDFKVPTKSGNTVLHMIALSPYRSKNVAHFVQTFTKTIPVNKQNHAGQTSLHLACKHHNFFLVQALCAAGANLNATNDKGKTPLHYLHTIESPHIFNQYFCYLTQRGANPNIRDNAGQKPCTTLHYSS